MKQLMIDAIVGIGFPTISGAILAEKAGLALFTGNQHRTQWVWFREGLNKEPEETLKTLYESLRFARAKENEPKAPPPPKPLIEVVAAI